MTSIRSLLAGVMILALFAVFLLPSMAQSDQGTQIAKVVVLKDTPASIANEITLISPVPIAPDNQETYRSEARRVCENKIAFVPVSYTMRA